MKERRFLAIVLAMLLMFSQVVFAEEAYVDLEARFDNVLTYEYNGVTHYMKDRVSTTLVLCANLSDETEAGAGSAELILLLPIDDDSRTSAPIQFDPGMTASWLEGENAEKTLGELFSEAENADAGSIGLMETINALFPAAVVEHYAVLDLRGLPKLDGIENDEANVTGEALVERLKAIKNMTEQDPEADLNSMLSALSGYIITDMKSGAMVKVVDKVDRYDRSSRVPFPVIVPEDETVTEILPDLTAFEDIMVGIYFDDTRAW